MMDRRIGAQLYTVRKEMQTMEDFEASMKKVKEIGYQTVQISGTPLPAKEMRKVLDDLGLQVMLSHRAFTDFKSDLGEIMDYNAALGCDSCCIGMAPVDNLKTLDSVKTFIEEMNGIADRLYENGFVFGYHNHCCEFAKHEGETIMDRFLRETDPKKVRFVVDTFWVQAGGLDPAKFIRSIGERAMFIHFKDYRVPTSDLFAREFAEIGSGNLNWDEIIEACDAAGARCALVEQDDCYGRDPFESFKMSYEFLKGKGFN